MADSIGIGWRNESYSGGAFNHIRVAASVGILSSEKKEPICCGKCNGNHGKPIYPPPRHRVHLKGSEDVRRLLSGVVNDLRQQKVDPVVAGKVIYGCQVLLNVFEQNNLADKIAELEKAMDQAGFRR